MLQTFVDQVAVSLREGLRQGRWTGTMPGRDRLAQELGVNGRTVDRALVQLEREGLLTSQGTGRPRRITKSRRKSQAQMRISAILYEQVDSQSDLIVELRQQMRSAGYDLHFAPRTLVELKHDPQRVLKLVEENPGNAWIIQAASRPVLEALSQSSHHVFSLFGAMTGLPLAGAGVDMVPTLREALHILFDLGHRRIVMLAREERQKTGHSIFEKALLEELEQKGVQTGPYHIPEWSNTARGLKQCLDGLFQVTPPTAIFVNDALHYLAVKNYLADQGGPIFRKVALICVTHDPRFDWCIPPVPHFRWHHRFIVRSVVRWANDISRGKENRAQRLTPSRLIGRESLEMTRVTE
jgi:DNA-binding LacI/PurR family transcriptional regulator